MMKENYERTVLTVTAFEQKDIITTSDLRVFSRDEYEGHVIEER